MSMRLVIAAMFLSAASVVIAQSLPEMRMTPQEIRASALDSNQIGSSGLPGVHTKVVFGDPSKASFYTILLFVPAHTTIQAHSHRDDRVATVVSGEWHFGYGDHFDAKSLKTLPPGKRVLGTGWHRSQSLCAHRRRSCDCRNLRLWSNRHALFQRQERSTIQREQVKDPKSLPRFSLFSKPKQVRNFHEELPAVVDEGVSRADQVSVEVKSQIVIQVLQVAVIADIHCSAGVDEIRDKKIRIQVLCSGQAGEGRISEYGGILHNDAGRELGRELIVPFRANDVVVEGSTAVVKITQPEPKIGVVDAQVTGGNDAEIGGHAVSSRQERIDAGRRRVVDAATPAPVDIEDNLLGGRRAEEEELGIAEKILVLRQHREIARTEKFGLLSVAQG